MQGQFERHGQFVTPNARKYMEQLCKHFAHKVPANVEGDEGHVTFGIGSARLLADDAALVAVLSGADEDALLQLQHVIDDHLKRFAFRENFEGMAWVTPASVM